VVFSFGVLFTWSQANFAATYTVTDLGAVSDVAGRNEARPNDLNTPGQVAGANGSGGVYRALVYNGSWTDLGSLGGNESIACGINDTGRVVGQSHLASGSHRAFLWTPGGKDGAPANPQMRDLGTLGGGESEAYAINDTGQITGFAQTAKNEHAFIFSGGKMTDIGALMKGTPNSFGYSINRHGRVAGTSYNSSYSTAHAFYYNGSTVTDLGTLGGGGASALAINDQDQIAGYASTAAGLDHAFRYAGGVMTDLGTLGGNYSYALSINNQGVVVGGSFIDKADLTYHAFVTAGNALVDLNTQLDASGAGWVLIEARTINDSSQIAGIGTLRGTPRGFLLSPSQGAPSPQILTQPSNQAVGCQDPAQFTLTATPAQLACQWYQGAPPRGTRLPSATNLTLRFAKAALADAGSYYAVLTNATGSVTSSAALLNVSDTAAPIISGCPANITLHLAPGASSGVASWPTPTATDACDGVTPVICTPASGSSFPPGTNIVRCVARDTRGNTNACVFTVAVLPTQPLLILGARVSGSDMFIRFATAQDARYAIQTARGISPAQWTPVVTDLNGTGSPVEARVSLSLAEPGGFFRVQRTSP
jgi:probable HAF family extracellular repeat protein